MSRRIKVAIAGAAAAVGVLGVSAATAPSALAVGACDSGAFCAYALTNYNASGAHFEFQGDDNVWASGVHNSENSVKNNGTTGLSVRVWDQDYFIDVHYCLYRGHALNLPSDKDEDGESHKWVSGATECF